MPGPAPTHRPTFTPAQLAECERLVRQHTAPQLQVARARLALLLHAEPDLDHVAAARRLGRHPNWVRGWRRAWAREGFRLADKPGRGRKPAFPPAGGGDGQGARLRAARAT
jgi:hypothetical protein